MNSLTNQTLAHCPNGCEPFEADYHCFIRADKTPELKEAILGGELNLLRCPECGAFFHHESELIYLDPLNELLVFVFAPEEKQKQALVQKRMEQDYAQVKGALHLDYAPLCVFGLEELKLLLEQDEQYALESEAVAAACAQAGYGVARLKPSYARAHHFPQYIPAVGQNATANDYAIAAAKVLKSGLHSTLLLNFKDHMSQEEAVLPHLL